MNYETYLRQMKVLQEARIALRHHLLGKGITLHPDWACMLLAIKHLTADNRKVFIQMLYPYSDATNLSYMIKGLVNRHMLERVQGSADQRTALVSLTGQGMYVAQLVEEFFNDTVWETEEKKLESCA